MQSITSRYETWLHDPYFDEATRQELSDIADNPEEIRDRFYQELSFGTGGLRGILGAGTNRMNVYTVRKATQGLAEYILSQETSKSGVVIAYDSRHCSPEFAKEAALCLCANNICAWLFDSLRPTPELSFAVRALDAIAGIVITASHNPAEYNGYKVYWSDGGQITPPRDREILTFINAVPDYRSAKTISEEQARAMGLLKTVPPEIDELYYQKIKAQLLHPEAIREYADKLRIVYTPLHGTGRIPVTRILADLGFSNVFVVPEQELPDGAFPTVTSPNPESPAAFSMALALAKETEADLVLATDPDADRLGVYVKDAAGNYHPLTGNMSGMLLLEYELSQRKALNLLPDNSAIVKTIVTGNMSREAAKKYNVELIETLTGFKYIGEQIKRFEETKEHTYVFGYEESYGCLIGTYARDKDAIVAVTVLCEAAAYYASLGRTLWEQMELLYKTYGYYMEDLISITLKGADGAATIAAQMESLRAHPPVSIGGYTVTSVTDYKNSADTGLPSSNVLYFSLEKDGWCCARPSGTEPKIKFYVGVKGCDAKDAAKRLKQLCADPLFHMNEG